MITHTLVDPDVTDLLIRINHDSDWALAIKHQTIQIRQKEPSKAIGGKGLEV